MALNMSDSESDSMPSNVFTFQNQNTTVSAKGPNMNSGNITNLSFRNNVMTSTMHMSRNFGRHPYGEPSFDQRSMYYRRERSPMSLYGGSETRGRNQSYYHGGMSSQRSMYNGRSGSPMSMRSMDSNASMSAVDIAMAFKNVKFNKYDLRMIKEAYNKFMKRRIRKKIEKRRNMRLFLKGYRRKSGYDSGEQGSDSSISSDDCKSTASAMYKDNMSSCRSTRTDLTDFRKKIKESNMYKDCTESFKQNVMKNMFSVTSSNIRDRFNTPNILPTPPAHNQTSITQKDRFQNGFLLPSQRFNKSVASVPIPEDLQSRQQSRPNAMHQKNHYTHTEIEKRNNETDSDQEEIFAEVTVREKSILNGHHYNNFTNQGKRNLEEIEESTSSARKRTKLSSPSKQPKVNGSIKDKKRGQTAQKINTKILKEHNASTEDNNSKSQKESKDKNDFEFIKPQLPVRKSAPSKPKEKLISKSAPPLVDAIIPQTSEPNQQLTNELLAAPATTNPRQEIQETAEEQEDTTHHLTNESMRPSFIKRKLFSQKMDVTEKKNMSSDALNVNSPQNNVYSAIQKEKHKARKLVTNQSCLSRDVGKEDNNLLDLIHKIVPPDRMNGTNITNKTSISTSLGSKSNAVDEDDKWDVTSVISTCNNDDVSDTFTDEEIFGMDEKKKRTKEVKIVKNNNNINNVKVTQKKINDCKILVEKLPRNIVASCNPTIEVNKETVSQEGNDKLKKSVYNCVKSFWDTDFESDVESSIPKRWTSAVKENQVVVTEKHNKSTLEADKTVKNKNTLNMSLASVSESIKSKTMPTNNIGKLKLNISKNLSIKSFLTPKNKKSKAKEQKIETANHKKEALSKPPNIDPDGKTKQPNKPVSTSKSTKNESDNKNKEVKKQNTVDKISDNVNRKVNSPNKAKLNKKTQSSNKIKTNNKPTTPNKSKTSNKSTTPNKSKTNIKSTSPNNHKSKNNKITPSPDKTKTNKVNQSPNKVKNKSVRPQNPNSTDKNSLNRSTSSRTIRTPKRKACCDELDHDKSTKPTKLNGNLSKKPKLVNNSPPKEQSVKEVNDNSKQKSRNNNSTKNSKKTEPDADPSIVYESEPSNRTLRSRRINLSSSINSSTENLTTLRLRTRRVDLSSSLKNSSLDENVTIKNSRSKAQGKKLGTKPGYAELLDKRQRSVKKR